MATAQSSTIAAIATPTGVGAISLVRVSGPNAVEIADMSCGGIASSSMPRLARRCKIRDKDGSVIDDGLLTVFLAPNSFTGEDTVEFAGHGGILDRCDGLLLAVPAFVYLEVFISKVIMVIF